VILIVTFGWAVVYASAMAWKSALPGSPVVMCHQSIVTGAAVVGADEGAAPLAGGAADAGADGELDEPAHAVSRRDAVASRTAIRWRDRTGLASSTGANESRSRVRFAGSP
jgi:hypothetical protein